MVPDYYKRSEEKIDFEAKNIIFQPWDHAHAHCPQEQILHDISQKIFWWQDPFNLEKTWHIIQIYKVIVANALNIKFPFVLLVCLDDLCPLQLVLMESAMRMQGHASFTLNTFGKRCIPYNLNNTFEIRSFKIKILLHGYFSNASSQY